MPDLTATETGIDTSAEAGASPEKITQEKVLEAYKYGKDKYLKELGKKRTEELTIDEISDLNAFRGAFVTDEHRIGADFNKGKFTYTNKIPNPNGGPAIEQEEGVPMEGIINFLEKKLITSKSEAEKKKIKETLKTLKDPEVSKTYEEAHEGQIVHIQPGETDDPVMFARKRQEAFFVSSDHRATGNMLENYNTGLATLKRRRELIVPSKTATTLPAAGTTADAITLPIDTVGGTTTPDKGSGAPNIIEAAEESEDDLADEDDTDKDDDNGEVEETAPAVAEASGIPGETILTENLDDTGDADEETDGHGDPGLPVPDTDDGTTDPGEADRHDTENPDEIKRISMGLYNNNEIVEKNSSLDSLKDFHEKLSKGRWWNIFRWPEKIGLRLGGGGIQNIESERLTRARFSSNNAFAGMQAVIGGPEAAEALAIKSEEQKKAVVARMEAGRYVEGTRNGQIIETRRLITEGVFKSAIMHDIIDPLIHSDNSRAITGEPLEKANEIRRRLTEIVKKNLNDPQIREIFGAEASDYGYIAEYFATDLLEKAEAVNVEMKKHDLSIDVISKYIDLHIGIARDQANTDVRSKVDKAVAWARRRQNDRMFTRGVQEVGKRTGWILNPAFVGVAVSLATQGSLSFFGVSGRVAGVAAPMTGLISGAAVGGIRRWFEIGGDNQMHRAERAMGGQIATKEEVDAQVERAKGLRGFLLKSPGAARMAGLYRRVDLEQFRYDSVKADNLINGSGEINNILDKNNTNPKRTLKSVDQLLSQALDIPAGSDDATKNEREANREAVAERMEEIRLRINRGKRERVDLLTFSDKTQVNQELNLLYDAADRLEQALKDSGADVADLKLKANNDLNNAFDKDKKAKDNGFLKYRASQSAGAAAFGGAIGLGSALTVGLAMQQGAAEIARHVPGISKAPIVGGIFQPGQTVLEKTAHNVGTLLGHPEIGTGPASVDTFKEMFDQGGRVNIGDITVQANSDHTLKFLDGNGKPIPNMPQAFLEPDGKIITTGNLDHLPNEIKGWTSTETMEHSIKQQIQEAAAVNEVTSMDIGDLAVGIKGDEVHILTNDQMNHETGELLTGQKPLIGTIDQDSNFHFKGATSEEISKIQAELAANGFKTNVEDIPGGTTTENPTEHFREKGMIEKIRRDLWHSNDTEMHIDTNPKSPTFEKLIGADGKEIQFHHNVLDNGSFDLDMSQMVSKPLPNGAGLNFDNSIDSQYAMLNKDITTNPDGTRTYENMFALFTLDDAGDNAREVIKVPFDASGHMNIPNDSELHQLFKANPDKTVTQLTRFVEVAHFNEASGKFDILATSVGSEAGPITVSTPGLHTLDATPPLAKEFLPPTVEAPPIIPIPFAPRHPLEKLEPSFIPNLPELPPIYYGGESLEALREWLSKNPHLLKPYKKINNPDGSIIWLNEEGNPVYRDISKERQALQQYLDEIKTSKPEYYAELEALTKETTVPEMNNECRVTVNIPAWMEGKNIYSVLDKYTQQQDTQGNSLNPDLYEINIIVNRKTGVSPDNTVAEIERFITEKRAIGKNYHINYIDVEFNPPYNNVGNARKMITDLTLLRSLKRSGQKEPLYIESEDADLLHIDPRTVINLINKLDQNPYLDAARGIQDRYPEELMKNDFLFLQRRLWDFTEPLLRRQKFRPETNPNWNFTWNRVITGGWNTGYTAEAYALIRGYDPNQTKGEDMTIGEKITMIRGDGNIPNLDVVGKVATRSDSSPRRFIGELITGKGAYTEAFEDEDVNAFIRDRSLEELLQTVTYISRINNSNEGSFAGMFEGHLRSIRSLTPNEEEAKKTFETVMQWCGFKKSDYIYESDGKLKISNWSNLQKALDDYRIRHQTARIPGERTQHANESTTPIRITLKN